MTVIAVLIRRARGALAGGSAIAVGAAVAGVVPGVHAVWAAAKEFGRATELAAPQGADLPGDAGDAGGVPLASGAGAAVLAIRIGICATACAFEVSGRTSRGAFAVDAEAAIAAGLACVLPETTGAGAAVVRVSQWVDAVVTAGDQAWVAAGNAGAVFADPVFIAGNSDRTLRAIDGATECVVGVRIDARSETFQEDGWAYAPAGSGCARVFQWADCAGARICTRVAGAAVLGVSGGVDAQAIALDPSDAAGAYGARVGCRCRSDIGG